ncbi:hypothetical protein Glove_624g41 [Diversispora epigaea]|uniref:Uncharacterized protein n=1 Tax=Diversispora epigaea TaxID=1348612 RepID=A0A397G5N9_9GLOM|nr:hypothetical protein Glove_624g41 [Diversispora epigaea]
MIVVSEGDDNDESDDLLNPVFECFREIMWAISQKAIESIVYCTIVDLWNKCLIPQYELESADEVYELFSQEVFRLQELYAKYAKIYR